MSGLRGEGKGQVKGGIANVVPGAKPSDSLDLRHFSAAATEGTAHHRTPAGRIRPPRRPWPRRGRRSSLTAPDTFTGEPKMRNRTVLAVLIVAALPAAAAADVTTKDVTLKSGKDEIKAFVAVPEGKGPFPGVVVIQEWWGLNDWIK